MQIVDSACRCIQVNGQQTTHFIAPDTESGVQKLYVVKDGKDICYVGITSQSISSRLRTGFLDYGHYGYHGYKWKDKLKHAELLVWAFADTEKDSIEAVEGELVYLVRSRTGRWPKYQMEIHFHPDVSDKEKQIAETLVNICLE
jgi:hypothetical protein